MKRGGSKQKGASFERSVCVALSKWVTNGKSEDCFWRSAMSGGRATLGKRKGTALARQAGDITATAPEGHPFTSVFYIECKHVKDLHIDQFLHRVGSLYRYWMVARKEARAHKRRPLLIAHQNRMPVLVLTTAYDFDKHLVPKKMDEQLDYSLHTMAIGSGVMFVTMFRFDDMLAKLRFSP